MGDQSRHSPQIWRTFYIEMDCHNTETVLELCYWLKHNNIRFCFQRYGEWTRGNDQTVEPEHVSFRIIAEHESEITKFRDYLLKEGFKFTEGSWDEEWRAKKAYDVGTKIYLLYLEEMKELQNYGEITDPDNYKGFILQMLHGFFNDLDMEYGDEELLLSNYLAGLMRRNGFSQPALNHIFNLNRRP